MPEKDYALEWYRYGLEKGNDSIVKFMMHWIAFNWLYSECQLGSERANINKYCEINFDRLTRYNPFVTDAFSVFKEGPVCSCTDSPRGRSPEDLHDDIVNRSGIRRIKSMLLTIYQVRCNLFHGSKRLYVDRDIKLVESSATIMEGYLKALLLDDSSY